MSECGAIVCSISEYIAVSPLAHCAVCMLYIYIAYDVGSRNVTIALKAKRYKYSARRVYYIIMNHSIILLYD